MTSTAATVIQGGRGRHTAGASRHTRTFLRRRHAPTDAAVAAGTSAWTAAATSGRSRPVVSRRPWRRSSTSCGFTRGRLRRNIRRSASDRGYPTISRQPAPRRRRRLQRPEEGEEGRRDEESGRDRRFRCCRTVAVATVRGRRRWRATTTRRRRASKTTSAGPICWAAAVDGGTRARTVRRETGDVVEVDVAARWYAHCSTSRPMSSAAMCRARRSQSTIAACLLAAESTASWAAHSLDTDTDYGYRLPSTAVSLDEVTVTLSTSGCHVTWHYVRKWLTRSRDRWAHQVDPRCKIRC